MPATMLTSVPTTNALYVSFLSLGPVSGGRGSGEALGGTATAAAPAIAAPEPLPLLVLVASTACCGFCAAAAEDLTRERLALASASWLAEGWTACTCDVALYMDGVCVAQPGDKLRHRCGAVVGFRLETAELASCRVLGACMLHGGRMGCSYSTHMACMLFSSTFTIRMVGLYQDRPPQLMHHL